MNPTSNTPTWRVCSGFTLVEGGDLTVRDRRVFLKTLDGLRPVDVVLRRVSDAFCDPLALRGESLLGVPGLVEAARAGQVSVANALGSGLVESPAFLPFLSGLATHLLGEELKLPSLATWWCGQVRERKYVEEHLDELFLRPAFSTAGPQAEPGRTDAGKPRRLACPTERASARVRGPGTGAAFPRAGWEPPVPAGHTPPFRGVQRPGLLRGAGRPGPPDGAGARWGPVRSR